MRLSDSGGRKETGPRGQGVLLVGNFSPEGRPYRQVCDDLALRLSLSGWYVTTTSRRPSRPAKLADMLATVWTCRGRYSVAQVDVFSGSAFVWAEAVGMLLRRVRKPFVLTLHGGNLPAFARRWPGRVSRLLRAAKAVTAPSPYLLEAMRPFRDDTILLPNPLEVASYAYRLRDRPRPRLVWLRAFHAMYNPALAVRTLAELAHDHADARLAMIGPCKGDGSLEQARRLAAELGVAERISFTGGVSKADVPARLDAGDVFLNTTNVDNTPVSVLEALASGMCVVSTDVGGLPELLTHETDSLLVPPDDPKAMADGVRRLLADPELAVKLSRNARAKAESSDWSAVLPEWERLLADLAASPNH